MGGQGKIYKQHPVGCLMETRGYCKVEKEALDGTL